jgi:hypothetical protein
MNRIKFFIIALIVIALFVTGFWLNSRYGIFKSCPLTRAAKDIYYCAMHPNFTSDKPGSCAICGMTLVKKQTTRAVQVTASQEKKILFYRNPMNPEITSPVPMKDEMGMDYVPVLAMPAGSQEPGASAEEAGVYISPEKQQLIGIKKEIIETKDLVHQILTVGKIAYDPELFVAQEEYLQALKAQEKIQESTIPIVKEQMQLLARAAKRKLLLLGMSEQSIEQLSQRGIAQDNLYLPISNDTVWVYITIYEYEAGLIKEGLAVEIEAVAFPGEIFLGKIVAITPVVNSQTRTIQVRAEIANSEHKLKPEMFVNAKINVDLGEKLAVPETAVLDTGLRKIVYLVKPGDILEAREVRLGQKAQGYYEVLDGVKAGDIVVTSGNFLVDSESKLKAAIQEPAH